LAIFQIATNYVIAHQIHGLIDARGKVIKLIYPAPIRFWFRNDRCDAINQRVDHFRVDVVYEQRRAIVEKIFAPDGEPLHN